jgi:glycosyltransferase involved in cell wall biosynthesis
LLIGQVARLDPMKDHPTLLRALARCLPVCSDLRLVVAGDGSSGYTGELERLACDLGLRERVLWLGERLDTPELYNAMDIHVLASAYGEGFPNAVAEAMATAVPCVVTRVGDAAEIVSDTGIAVSPRDPEALSGALRQLLSASPEERRELGRRARRRIEDRYSVAAMVERYLRLYRTLKEAR